MNARTTALSALIAIRRQNAFSKGLRRSFHRFFRDILGGSAVDRGYGYYCLHSRSWKP